VTFVDHRTETARRQPVDGRAAAIKWRLTNQLVAAMEVNCLRCEDSGLTWWCGKPGEGGRRGPCPRCRVMAAQRFVMQLGRETFGG
jgi:hypothetical protein